MMVGRGQQTTFLVTSYPGQASVAELRHQADMGDAPRRDYVEAAYRFGVEVVDSEYLSTRATPVARWAARHAGIPLAQICEAVMRGGAFGTVWAWSDRTGLPLALVRKLTRARKDLVLVSAWLSRPKKAVFLRPLGVGSHIRAILSGSRAQLDFAAGRLSVPREKLYFAPWPVDEQFWKPQPCPSGNMICSVGMEARDYSTLLDAVRQVGVRVDLKLAVGTVVFTAGTGGGATDGGSAPFQLLKRTFGYRFYRRWARELDRGTLPANVFVEQQLGAKELRDLYAAARFVVVPLHDVDSDCGITTITEAMAMGKAVIVSRSRGQVDVFEDGREGLYVPPYDASALRSAIEHLLSHPEEAERMGRQGRALVERRHSLDLYLAQIGGLLEGDGESTASPAPADPG